MIFSARIYRFFAGYADKIWGQVIPLDQKNVFDYATYEPLGVIALITAWNSPMALLANKLPAALAAGNCVVVKPSEHASVTTLEFCSLMEKAGFPPGVFNVVTGDRRTGEALVAGGGIDKISFTGCRSHRPPYRGCGRPEFDSRRHGARRQVARTSFSTTPISTRRLSEHSRGSSPRRARPALPDRACWFSVRSTMKSPTAWPVAPRRSSSAIRSIPRPRWALRRTNRNSTRS